MKSLLKFYFTKFNNLDKDLFNLNKNGAFNINIRRSIHTYESKNDIH